MTEEIKEIIDYLIDEECTRRIKCITIEESKQLLDYIKNLQQENKRLKEKIDILKSNFETEIDDCEDYKKWYRDYKSRCEKANKLLKTIYKALPGTYNQLLIEIDNYLQESDENE